MSVRRSLAWTYSAQGLSFLISFSSTIVVARLVTPRDFGIFAMAGAVAIVINVLMQFGLAKYITREAEIGLEKLRAVFTVNVFMSLLYCGSLLIGALVARHMIGSDEVADFLLVFAIFPLFAMMEFIPAALSARDMKFGLIAVATVTRAVVVAGTTVALALLGYAYMSFAWAQVVTSLATALIFNVAVWRPEVWRLRFRGLRSIAQFGAQMIGISGINQFNVRGGEMALGSLLGLTSLGFYSRASSLPQTIYQNVLGPGSNVIFSKLAADLRETGAIHDTYVRFMRLLLALMWPMLLGIAVLAQPVIFVLYGSQWQEAAVPLALLAIATAATAALGLTGEVFILRGETGRQIRIEAIRAALGISIFIGGAMISLTMAAAARIAEALLAFLLYRRSLLRLVGGPRGPLRMIYLEAVLAAGLAIAPSFALMVWWSWSPNTPIAQIALAVLLGIAAWALFLVWRRHPLYLEVVNLLKVRRTPPG